MLRLVFLTGFSIASLLLATDYPVTEITLGSTKTQVYFNDGDTFRLLAGPLKGKSARIKGINTLESYGPVHQWGNWRADELLDNAKAATQNARKGGWHCDIEANHDTYGRLLANCADLSKSQVEQGLAHVMFVGASDSNPELIETQRNAIKHRAGMWQKGSVDFILTSAHSPNEPDLKGKAYDRFVSTTDGQSLVKTHIAAYKTCEVVHYAPKPGATASSMLYIPFNIRYGNKNNCF